MKTVNTWVIEKQEQQRTFYFNFLNKTNGITCPFAFEYIKDALEVLQQYLTHPTLFRIPDVILLNAKGSNDEGPDILNAIHDIRQCVPQVKIVMVVAENDPVLISGLEGVSSFVSQKLGEQAIVESVKLSA